jgi:riboflavin kinase/FMN adenylyltransferase
MKVLCEIGQLQTLPGPIILAIGVFDGVHLGHRAVIERALDDACKINGTAAVVTFDPHPSRILRPESAPRLLTSTLHKTRLIAQLGVPALVVQKFDAAFASLSPEDFIRRLAASSDRLREICVGHQWSFGKDRRGNLGLLAQLGDQLAFEEVGVPAVRVEQKIVSSTEIRAAVESGNLAAARKMLGREYTILGTVVEGDHLGRTIGFPTANLAAHNEQFPPNGVYAVEALIDDVRRRGVANVGVRPTIHSEGGNRILELHLFDFDGDLYGQELEVSFGEYLRPEKKFANVDELRARIALDIIAAHKSGAS